MVTSASQSGSYLGKGQKIVFVHLSCALNAQSYVYGHYCICTNVESRCINVPRDCRFSLKYHSRLYLNVSAGARVYVFQDNSIYHMVLGVEQCDYPNIN